MAHFAKINDDNVVTRVIVVDNKELINKQTLEEDEILGMAFCIKLFGGRWIQTSYNGNFRKRYAGVGYTYDSDLDAFIDPKPYDSWILNRETIEWESPIGAAPELTESQISDGCLYVWDEELQQWTLITPPF